ncbi:ApeA N-terminal domain 1-containing protein [Streptomyces halstedii]|uniref:ApeA N-terminal domain 1-containing protein n=1 Tax=Streptomyces halstedii TaxID=1944 RepID=UPI0037FE8BCF
MRVADITDGAIGFFWASYGRRINFRRRPESGFIKINGLGQFEVQTLEESPHDSFEDTPQGMPMAVFASTPKGGMLLVDLFKKGYRTSWDGVKASTRSFTSQAAILGASGQAPDPRLSYLSFFVPGVHAWAGVRTVEERSTKGASGRVRAVDISLKSAEPKVVHITDTLDFELSWHWEVSGESGRRIVYAPVSIAMRTTRPRVYSELAAPLHKVQDLINFAFSGFVAADGGRAHLAADPNPRSSPTVWDARLMTAPAGVKSPNSMTELPLFSLDDVGGADGIKRWMRLYGQHPRAVRPFVSRYRIGPTSPEVQLMEVAAGMEYWVACHRRNTKWAKEGRIPLGMANRVGSSFCDWVQEPEKWDAEFWNTYNSLKHEPAYKPDRYAVSVMAQSGALLLAASILNRMGGGKRAGARIFASHRLYDLGQDVSACIANAKPRGIKRRRGK